MKKNLSVQDRLNLLTYMLGGLQRDIRDYKEEAILYYSCCVISIFFLLVKGLFPTPF